jgi:hypothetical protein
MHRIPDNSIKVTIDWRNQVKGDVRFTNKLRPGPAAVPNHKPEVLYDLLGPSLNLVGASRVHEMRLTIALPSEFIFGRSSSLLIG